MGQLVVGNMFGVLIKMAFPEKDDELGPGLDFDIITLLLSPAGAALGKLIFNLINKRESNLRYFCIYPRNIIQL